MNGIVLAAIQNRPTVGYEADCTTNTAGITCPSWNGKRNISSIVLHKNYSIQCYGAAPHLRSKLISSGAARALCEASRLVSAERLSRPCSVETWLWDTSRAAKERRVERPERLKISLKARQRNDRRVSGARPSARFKQLPDKSSDSADKPLEPTEDIMAALLMI